MIPVDMAASAMLNIGWKKTKRVSPIHGIHDGQSNDISGK